MTTDESSVSSIGSKSVRALCSHGKVVCLIYNAARAWVIRLVVCGEVVRGHSPVVGCSSVIGIYSFSSEFHDETMVLQ